MSSTSSNSTTHPVWPAARSRRETKRVRWRASSRSRHRSEGELPGSADGPERALQVGHAQRLARPEADRCVDHLVGLRQLAAVQPLVQQQRRGEPVVQLGGW
jgi:hypothetical protein